MARQISEINAGSMADIAFLLLIFFLVATTMDVDSGISTKLPPMPEKDAIIDDSKVIKERNVFVVLISASDQLMVEGKQISVSDLRAATKEFILNPNNKENLPEKRLKDIDYFGEVMSSKGIVSLMNDRGTSYGLYIKVQNELNAAFNEVRDELAMRQFGTHFNDLIKEKRDAVKDYIPQVISEAEPKNVGGN